MIENSQEMPLLIAFANVSQSGKKKIHQEVELLSTS